MVRCLTAFAFATLLPVPAFAQARAEGVYPATLLCQGGPGELRARLTVEIIGGKARYSVSTPVGIETGEGTLANGTLVLVGRTKRYEARYSGGVDGLGGLLTGRQTGPGFARTCQLSLGNGRG